MIKELDNRGQEKVTPFRLFNEKSGGAESENSQMGPSAEEIGWYSSNGSSKSKSRGRPRSKSKSVKLKPQSVRVSQRKSSSDSGYDKDPMEIHGIKRKPNEGLQAFMNRVKAESAHIKGVPLVLRISAFMHGHGHPELVKKLNDKISKTVDEMWERVRAFTEGENLNTVAPGTVRTPLGGTSAPAEQSQGGPSPAFVKEDIDVLTTMIKKLDNRGQEKVTPFKFFNEKSGGAEPRSAQKHRKSASRKKGISKSHRPVRSEARSRSKSKSVKLKPQSVRVSQRKSSSDSGVPRSGRSPKYLFCRDRARGVAYASMVQDVLPDPKWFGKELYDKDPTEIHGIKRKPNEGLQAFMDCVKAESAHIKGVPLVLRISAFMHGHGHPELAKNLNDKIPKTVDEMWERVRAFIRGETAADTTEVIRSPRWKKSAGKASWKIGSSGERHQVRQPEGQGLSQRKREGYQHGENPRLSDEVKAERILSTTGRIFRRSHLPLGVIDLEVTMGECRKTRTVIMEFAMVKSPSPYNALLATIATTRETLRECSQIEEAQALSRHSRVTDPTLTQTSSEVANPRGKKPPKSSVEEKIVVNYNYPEHLITIGGGLSAECRHTLIHTLRKNVDFFAWNPVYMTDIPRAITEHSLDIYPHIEPKAQKNRRLALDRRKVMIKKDKEKTTFHTEEGVSCYMKMPFGLKNAGATYQRLVDSAFKEPYRVTSEGIRANPEKAKAIMDMPSPKTLKQMHSLSGKLTTLNRFLSKLFERSLPLLDTLKKCTNKKDFRWTEAAEAASLEMKKLVSKLPTFTTPKKGETLMMYLDAENETVSTVLLTERDGRQIPIHYVRVLRRLAKWAVELGAYGITYVPRVAVKGQVLADFIADTPTEINVTPERLYTDEASNNEGSEAGLILIALDDVEYSYALYSKPLASQVEGSYEAKGERMKKYREKVLELAGAFNRFWITHIPIVENRKADALSKLAAVQFDHLSKVGNGHSGPFLEGPGTIYNVLVPTPDHICWIGPILPHGSNGLDFTVGAKRTGGNTSVSPERPRVYSDLTSEEKDRYNANIRATNILLQGLSKDIYTLINHYIDAKDIWDNVKMLLEGFELTKEDRESQLYDDFEHFRHHKGESIHDYYVRFAKLINDMRNINMTMSKLQLNSKFVNNMLPEWGRYMTDVKLNRGLRYSNYDQLYAYLKQHETHAKESKMILERFSQPIVDPLALLSNVSNPQHYLPSSSASYSTRVPPPLAESSSPTEYLIENLTNTLALLTQSYRTFLPQTNNQLRTSSNARNQATVQDGRLVVQNVQGRPNRGQGMNPRGGNAAGYGGAPNRVGNDNQGQARPGQARTVKCYNCNGTWHIA
nr:reverse transcriptase domain-containing protein [Tanacetum cinerariifolium]